MPFYSSSSSWDNNIGWKYSGGNETKSISSEIVRMLNNIKSKHFIIRNSQHFQIYTFPEILIKYINIIEEVIATKGWCLLEDIGTKVKRNNCSLFVFTLCL